MVLIFGFIWYHLPSFRVSLQRFTIFELTFFFKKNICFSLNSSPPSSTSCWPSATARWATRSCKTLNRRWLKNNLMGNRNYLGKLKPVPGPRRPRDEPGAPSSVWQPGGKEHGLYRQRRGRRYTNLLLPQNKRKIFILYFFAFSRRRRSCQGRRTSAHRPCQVVFKKLNNFVGNSWVHLLSSIGSRSCPLTVSAASRTLCRGTPWWAYIKGDGGLWMQGENCS